MHQTPRHQANVSTHSRPKAAGKRCSAKPNTRGSFNTQPPEGGWVNAYPIYDWHVVSTHSRPKAAGMPFAPCARATTWFQHTAARRRLEGFRQTSASRFCFNTQPPEGGWRQCIKHLATRRMFQHTAARRRLGSAARQSRTQEAVSTHSRPKAAGSMLIRSTIGMSFQHTAARRRLGCHSRHVRALQRGFNTQPPEGGWRGSGKPAPQDSVSTHSRPKAAGLISIADADRFIVSTHSRPKAAGIDIFTPPSSAKVSTHSRPKAAGFYKVQNLYACSGFNTQPPEGGWGLVRLHHFQIGVSTHSRPKAAGQANTIMAIAVSSFNTQPPEGGWRPVAEPAIHQAVSTHSRPKAAGITGLAYTAAPKVSTHSRPKAAGAHSHKKQAPHPRFNTQPPEGGWASRLG